MITKTRNTFFVLLGVAGLLLKPYYTGPWQETVYSYLGNVSVSFAVYFIATNLPLSPGSKRLLTAALALAVVELFEVLDGFGVMSNVYDPVDLLANLGGVALALALDTLLAHRRRASSSVQPMQPESQK